MVGIEVCEGVSFDELLSITPFSIVKFSLSVHE